MATTTKKGSTNKKAKLRRPVVKTSPGKQAQTIAELRQQLAECMEREKAALTDLQERDQQLTEALEQQTATSEILGVIASSPTDIQPVLNAVAENAARLCDANDAVISRVEGNVSRIVAAYGSIPLIWRVGETYTMSRGTPAGRAMLDRETIHVHDIAAEIETEFPQSRRPSAG